MPVNKNAMVRYQILDRLLSNPYHNYSMEDLNEECNNELEDMGLPKVSKRQTEKDIKFIEYDGPFLAEIDRFCVDAVSQKTLKAYKKHCLRYHQRSYSIFRKEMTDDELYLLKEALSILGQFDGLPNFEGLDSLMIGIQSATNKRIVSFTKNPLENSTLFGRLFAAISNRQVIELEYHLFSNADEKRKIMLSPYLLKEYNRRWYLFGAAYDDGKILNFALDRIDDFKAMESCKYVECKEVLEERFDDIIGVTLYENKPVEHILFWVSDKSKDYVLTKPIHDSQRYYRGEKEEEYRRLYPKMNGGAFFSIDCIYNYELIRELTSFGSELIVLSPKYIQDAVFDRILSMYEKYSSLRS